MTEQQKKWDYFMEGLRTTSPEDLVNFYFEAKFGKNFVAEDKLPIEKVRNVQIGLTELLEEIQSKMN